MDRGGYKIKLVGSPDGVKRNPGFYLLDSTAFHPGYITLVDVWVRRLILRSRYMKGFLFGQSGCIRDLTESELWDYD